MIKEGENVLVQERNKPLRRVHYRQGLSNLSYFLPPLRNSSRLHPVTGCFILCFNCPLQQLHLIPSTTTTTTTSISIWRVVTTYGRPCKYGLCEPHAKTNELLVKMATKSDSRTGSDDKEITTTNGGKSVS